MPDESTHLPTPQHTEDFPSSPMVEETSQETRDSEARWTVRTLCGIALIMTVGFVIATTLGRLDAAGLLIGGLGVPLSTLRGVWGIAQNGK